MNRIDKLRRFYNRYERYLIPGALVVGFTTDVLTFRFINFPLAMSLLFFQLVLIGANISIINLYEAKKIAGKFFSYWRILAPLLLQYSFGNLFSAFLIFYSHSGSFFASWPFIIIIIFLMIGNEIFRKYNVRPTIHLSVYFFAIFSYFNLLLPNILKNLSVFIFLGSGLFSLALIILFVNKLSLHTFQVAEKKQTILYLVGGIFFFMNFLYFFNLVPPIPLSLRQVGVYHEIERVNSDYQVVTEECGLWDSCFLSHERRHISSSRERIYVFSAIFAPGDMELEVVHEWERFNKKEKRWEKIADIPFRALGGRDEGHRWYTYYNAYPGRWRVNIKTAQGQTIGRKDFYIIQKAGVERIEEKI